jgi:conjugative transfer region protein TrbK
MDGKLLARIGAIAFAAIAITATALEMRNPAKPAPVDEVMTVMEPDGDPLPAILRDCASLGEVGAHDRQCLDAWAENRRRFLSPKAPSNRAPIAHAPSMPIDAQPANEAFALPEGAQ